MKLDFKERRLAPRYPVRQPITIKGPEPGLPSWGEDPGQMVRTGTSRDVSASGIFVWIDERIPENSNVEVIMTLPRELSQTGTVTIRCVGNVLRVHREKGRKALGLAIAFEQVQVVEPDD
jgi:hypothetical protein